MKIGLVGLPKSGKTTLFNLLTGSNVPTSRYDGGRAELHTGVARVPDARVDTLSRLFSPKKTTYATFEVVDLAGIEKGGPASLDTKEFRNADALLHVVRGFGDEALGAADPRRDIVDLETELNLYLFNTEQTKGWVSSHVDIVDQFSPAERPGATRSYTHKLDFEWDTAFHVFSRFPEGHWLRNVEAEVSLDYLATGLPKAGDVIGDARFIDRASPWSLSFVMVIPLAPLNP